MQSSSLISHLFRTQNFGVTEPVGTPVWQMRNETRSRQSAEESQKLCILEKATRPPVTLHRPPPWHPPADPSMALPPQRYVPLRRTRATTCGSHTRAQGDLHAHPGVLVPRELGAPAGLFSEISDLNSDFEDRNAFGAIIRARTAVPPGPARLRCCSEAARRPSFQSQSTRTHE
eukprot:COSAG03_NODE_5498_length_1234_cov_4.155066_1_plen_174_part_00